MIPIRILRIEIDRRDGQGWRTRSQGIFRGDAQDIPQHLVDYCINYAHRAFLDDKLVASCEGRSDKVAVHA